ncbi:hypothetical protein ACFSKI_21430 [Pseudogracilibacillus auburnensis]|uniref:Uncharacterized protein n=1 Tax=Pseudogracilibacillus auburnensis TaxID=1494959 RepID=A0A2V3VIL4_9BACI|nr:hypothetical protein [Pseudogracilibacillus auburnensis]PXW81643.1 hypothetical protein DFR56_12016 [Pseudogracilibacillus auburnensis]
MKISWIDVLNSNFLGALAGAIVTGLVAIYVLRKDIKFQLASKKEELENNYKKAFILIEMWSNSFLETYSNLNELLNYEKAEKKQQINMQLEAVRESKYRLDNVNDDYIPQEVYQDFIDLKVYIDLIFHEYSAYTDSIQLIAADNSFILARENEAIKSILINSYEEIYDAFKLKLNRLAKFRESL